jgi:hypothetical protein
MFFLRCRRSHQSVRYRFVFFRVTWLPNVNEPQEHPFNNDTLSSYLPTRSTMAPSPHAPQLQDAVGFVNPVKSHITTFLLQSSYNQSSTNPTTAISPPAQPQVAPHTKHPRAHAKSPHTITKPSKRKAKDDARPKTKKQKKHAQSKKISDEDFRTSETQQLDMPQAIGTMNAQTPLTNVERWRLRGWTWPEALMNEKVEQRFGGNLDDYVEAESPTGTMFLWRIQGVGMFSRV